MHAYHHFAVWRTLFEELGWEVVLSGRTDRAMIDEGVRVAPAELCLPAKAMLGHVAAIRDQVDALFLPRIVCTRVSKDWFFGCPKAIALPDLTRAVFGSLPKVIEPVLDVREGTMEQAFCAALSGFHSAAALRAALRQANAAGKLATETTHTSGSPLHLFDGQGRLNAEHIRPVTIADGNPLPQAVADGNPLPQAVADGNRLPQAVADGNPLPQAVADGNPLPQAVADGNPLPHPEGRRCRVGVVGHTYLLFDSGLCLDVLDRLRQAGAEPVLAFPTEAEVEREAGLATALNWLYELELMAGARRLLEQKLVDGLLLVSSFACGTGAVTNEWIQRTAVHRHGTPTVLLLLDEHTGEAGVTTRLESFVDVLRMRRK